MTCTFYVSGHYGSENLGCLPKATQLSGNRGSKPKPASFPTEPLPPADSFAPLCCHLRSQKLRKRRNPWTQCRSLKFVDPMNEWGDPVLAFSHKEDATFSLHREKKKLQSRKWRGKFQENTNIQSKTMDKKTKAKPKILLACYKCTLPH